MDAQARRALGLCAGPTGSKHLQRMPARQQHSDRLLDIRGDPAISGIGRIFKTDKGKVHKV